jgi:hypothetical protein
MGLNAKNISNNTTRVAQKNLDADVYPGRLVQIIDLGLQPQDPYEGKPKPPINKISFTYELAEEFMKDEDGKDMEDKPRWISEEMALYGLGADKAKSTLRYNAFDPEGVFNGDFARCVGAPVNVTVVNKISKGKTYDNVGNISPMSAKRKATLPELKNPPKVFDLDNPDMDIYNSLPPWIQDKIKGNLNFNGSPLQRKLGGEAKKTETQVVEEEDNPY